MASLSSWNGEKCHGHRVLLTDVLKGELGFQGFVVSDWDGTDQLDEDYAVAIERAVNAVRQAVDSMGAPGFNLEIFDGKGLDATRVVSAARTLPMMADMRFVLVRRFDAMAPTDQRLAAIVTHYASCGVVAVGDTTGMATKMCHLLRYW